jgi:NAD-dependent SIR2 family protein deacetylase
MISRCQTCGQEFEWAPLELFEPDPPNCVACETAETFDWLSKLNSPNRLESKVERLLRRQIEETRYKTTSAETFPP